MDGGDCAFLKVCSHTSSLPFSTFSSMQPPPLNTTLDDITTFFEGEIMPEASPDATIIIATSWQAKGRAETGDMRTIICNCTVIIVFAAFYIEANLNHIIETMGKTKEMKDYFKRRPGLQDKLVWFYTTYCADDKTIRFKKALEKIKHRFPGFDEIYKFRNDVSHGVINRSLANLDDAKRLRANAIDIVSDLFDSAKKAGCDIPRSVTYEFAISSEDLTS